MLNPVSSKNIEELFNSKILWVAEKSSPSQILSTDAHVFFRFSAGEVHEWCVDYQDTLTNNPPTSIFSLILLETLTNLFREKTQRKKAQNKYLFWIGEKVWPTPYLLKNCSNKSNEGEAFNLLERSIFISPKNEREILWATETALASKGTFAVVADCSSLGFIASRRFLLAAKKSLALGFIVKDLKNIASPTASTSTWHVTPKASFTHHPQWELALVRSKQSKTSEDKWSVECRYEKSKVSLHILSNMVDQSHSKEARFQSFG